MGWARRVTRRRDNDELARNPVGAILAPPGGDRIEISDARTLTGVVVQARPRERHGSPNERRVAGLIIVGIDESR